MNILPLYIHGKWSGENDPIAVDNPATSQTIAHVATVNREEVAAVIRHAGEVMADWQHLCARDRGAFLHAMADDLEARSEAIARIITMENGKPIAQSKGEVAMSVDHLRWFAEEGKRAYGRIVPPQARGKRHMVLKQPVGVVGAIAPWNFPLVLSVRKVAPALAAGCPVILKPASATPLCALELARAAATAELPAGVFQVVLGKASMIAKEMMNHPVCRKVTFTGSTAVGKQLIEMSAQTVTRLSMELGGHAPVVIFDDADLDQAVEGALITKFRNTGQSCIAANRIFVQSGIYDRFIEAFSEKAKALKVGDGLEQGVDIGPMIDDSSLQTAIQHIEDARSHGASVVCGGSRQGDQGWFLPPTVLTDVPDDALCMREETFAPVAPVCRFNEESEGIERANRTSYGLAAYAYTSNLNRAWRVAEQLEAGTVGVNDAVPSTTNCPFGGMKESGLGRELGMEGLDAFLEVKHVSFGGLHE